MTHTTIGFGLVDLGLGLVSTLVGCVAAVVLPEQPNGWVALVVATTGMITALGAVTTSVARIWAEHRRHDREALSRRHELDQKLSKIGTRLDVVETNVKQLFEVSGS